ncbi:MAG: hypothetical protein HY911_03055 [Desulfobacterales bacterium]|nr:hypothetical protein [Desulfobacterales bacterium]
MHYSTQMKARWLVLLAIVLISFLAAPAAADRDGHRVKPPTQEGTDHPLPVVTVTIDSKSTGSVTTTVGDSYAVDSDTMIVQTDGHQVSIRKMLVPCEAEVTYSEENGTRKATRIEIKKVGNNPRWQWTSARPE